MKTSTIGVIVGIVLVIAIFVGVVVVAIKVGPGEPPIVTDPNTLKVGISKTINWNVNNMRSHTVEIGVIQRTGFNPSSYIGKRVIAVAANEGTWIWTVTSEDIGEEIYIEVRCKNVSTECQALPLYGPYKVINSNE